MTIDVKCLVCRNADRRRLIELGWNGGMDAATIARVLDQRPLSGAVILKHLKEHADGDANLRAVVVEPERPVRERVLEIQRTQLDEVERRIALAKQRADMLNAEHQAVVDSGVDVPPGWHPHDWSEFYDILGKDSQAAIQTILRTQGLTDKREQKTNELKLGLFESMAKAGLAPKALIGGVEVPQLSAPEEVADDASD